MWPSATFILPKWNFSLYKPTKTPKFPDMSKLNRLERLAGVVVTNAFLGKWQIPNTSTYKLDSRYYVGPDSLSEHWRSLAQGSEDLRHRIASHRLALQASFFKTLAKDYRKSYRNYCLDWFLVVIWLNVQARISFPCKLISLISWETRRNVKLSTTIGQ
jgi:hypothetical protein